MCAMHHGEILYRSLAGGGPIDEIIVLDREVDAVTPMCTQLTYEGLVDETMQIKNGSVSVDNPSGTDPPPRLAAICGHLLTPLIFGGGQVPDGLSLCRRTAKDRIEQCRQGIPRPERPQLCGCGAAARPARQVHPV